MSFRPTTVERAFQLASSGECPTLGDIRSRLSQEGYHDGPSQISGPSLLKQLRKLCVEAAERVSDDSKPAVEPLDS